MTDLPCEQSRSTQVLKSVLSTSSLSRILSDLEEIIDFATPTSIPPLNDDTPFYYYVVPSSDPTRSLIHLSLATWPTNSALQASLLSELEPLYKEYIARHPQPELDAFGLLPSTGRCSRYTFNLYPIHGYTQYHQDPINNFHPFQLLALIQDPFSHSLYIQKSEFAFEEYSSAYISAGDCIYFDPQRSHAVLPPKLDPETLVYPKLIGNYRIDCAYINLDATATQNFLKRQNLFD